MTRIPAAVLAVSLALPLASMAAGNPVRGRELVETRCVACHSLDANRIGPALGSVVGRPAGRQPGYAYSTALAAGGPPWTAERLRSWLTDPSSVYPGTAMGYRLDDARDREDVIAFLVSLAKPRSP